MDPETAKLAVEMQLADIAAIIDDLYFDEDDPDHDEIASFRMMERDMQRQLEILEGQVLTLNILKDEHEGRVAFAKLLEEEKQAVTDHQLAMSLAGMGIGHSKVKSSNDYEATLCDEEDSTRDEQWEMAKELYSAAFNRDGSERRSPRKTESVKAEDLEGGDKGGVLGSNALTKCIACMDVVATKDTITLDCDPEPHTYCRTCLTDLFKSAIYDTTLFPPRCCRAPISLEVSRAVLPKDLIKDFDIKVEELATPNPTYCSNAECAKFIQLKDIKGDVGTCVFCREETCVLCKCKSHGGLCPSDPHVQLLMDAAKRSKWQQCLRCKNMVELVTGCFHMTYVYSIRFTFHMLTQL